MEVGSLSWLFFSVIYYSFFLWWAQLVIWDICFAMLMLSIIEIFFNQFLKMSFQSGISESCSQGSHIKEICFERIA